MECSSNPIGADFGTSISWCEIFNVCDAIGDEAIVDDAIAGDEVKEAWVMFGDPPSIAANAIVSIIMNRIYKNS